MTRRLSPPEKDRIRELNQDGFYQKEISDKVCTEFGRITLDRTTIYRFLQIDKLTNSGQDLSPKTVIRLPQTPTQQAAWERCQIRSERYPKGDHSWMIGDRFADSFTVNDLDDPLPKGEFVRESEGWFTTSSTCWFCSFTTEPKRDWGPILVVAE